MHPIPSRLLVGIALLSLAGLWVPPEAHAQSVVRGGVRGTVQSEEGRPLVEAIVTATDVLTQTSRWTETDRRGRFEIHTLQPGSYEVRVEALGYRPRVLRTVSVRPGHSVRLPVELTPAPPPVEAVDTVETGTMVGARFFRSEGQRIARDELDAFPDLHRSLAELAARSSDWDASLGTQGLPDRLTEVYLDGIPFTPARHPLRDGGALARLSLPRTGFRDLQLMDVPADVEWQGAAGGYVVAGTRASRNRPAGTVLLSGSADPVWFDDGFKGPSKPSALSGWGAVTRDIPLVGDSSRLFVALEGMRVSTPRSAPLGGALTGELASDPGVSEAVADPWTDDTWSVSGLTRLDWNLSPETEVMARLSVGHLENEGGRFFDAPSVYGSSPHFSGTDVVGALSILSRIRRRLSLELRAGVTWSDRWFGAAAGGGFAPDLPATHLTQSRVLLGRDPGVEGRVLRTAFSASSALHAELGEHGVKIGFDAALPSYEYDHAFHSGGEFFFSDPAGLAARQGAWVGLSEEVLPSAFSVPEIGGFAQYTWDPLPEFRLMSGVRAAWEFLPTDDVVPNLRWEELTGLRNDALPQRLRKIGARVGVSWDLTGEGTTILQGTFAAHHDRLDPAALHEVISLAGAVRSRRVLGDLGAWPEPPGPGVPGDEGTLLAVPGPDLEAPRTAGGTISLQQVLGTSTVLRLSGTFRRTDFLLRREDLNRSPGPSAFTAAGRPIYGELVKVGGVLQAAPGSDRRFSEFDAVWGLSADGWSEYSGASVALEHATPWADLFASYTLSETEDNWVGAGLSSPGASLDPGLGGALSRQWRSGVSDLDVPHRIVAGAHSELPVGRGVGVGVFYRFRSGLPFTPTYPVGVDVNGDGSARNDPAFVPDRDEIRALSGRWSCVASSIGRFSPRNACRPPFVHTLDARLSAALFEVRGTEARILVEGLNLLDAEIGPRDTALLLVDPSGALSTDPETGALVVPTVVNPGFGRILRVAGSGRRIRVGFTLGGL